MMDLESMAVGGEAATSLQCLLCGSLRHRVVFRELDVDILRCLDCGHVFSSFAADPYYDGFWGDEIADDGHAYWSKARDRMYQDFLTKFVANRSGRLLDLGCGLGFFVRRVARFANWEAYGSEISSAAVRYAREKLKLDNIICGRPEDLELPEGSFDVITMWDVIDHILHPDPLLHRCHALLRDGGICFIRTPNVRVQFLRARISKLVRQTPPRGSYLQARDHLHQYSTSTIRKLLVRNGFTRVEFIHLHPVQNPDSSGVLRAAKNLCFEVARAGAVMSRGYLNFDNLFVVAHK
jgi:SAM-dependent methyltransferase